MIKNEQEARQACIDIIDHLINDQKKNISTLEIMKEHINDMSSEQLEEFGLAFSLTMAPDIIEKTLKATSTIMATKDTIEFIKWRKKDGK